MIMKKLRFILLLFLFLNFSSSASNYDDLVFTAFHELNSRIYVMRMDGTIHHHHFEYNNYRFSGC